MDKIKRRNSHIQNHSERFLTFLSEYLNQIKIQKGYRMSI